MVSSVQSVNTLIVQSSSESVSVNLKQSDADDSKKSKLMASEIGKSIAENNTKKSKDSYKFSDLAEGLNNHFKNDENFKVEFTKDKATEKMVYKVIDKKTSQILDQVPKEVELKISKFVSSQLADSEKTDAKI